MGFAGGSDSKDSACNAGDLDSIPGSGRSPGEGNGYPLQYSCLENSRQRSLAGSWGHKESDKTNYLIFMIIIIHLMSYSLLDCNLHECRNTL